MDKKSNEGDEEVTYYMDSMGKVQYKVNAKKQQVLDVDMWLIEKTGAKCFDEVDIVYYLIYLI